MKSRYCLLSLAFAFWGSVIFISTLQANVMTMDQLDPRSSTDQYDTLLAEYYAIDSLSLIQEVTWNQRLYDLSVINDNDSTAFYHSYDLSSIYFDLDSIELSYENALLAIGHLKEAQISPIDEAFLYNNIGTLY